jgi:hypothetical protein
MLFKIMFDDLPIVLEKINQKLILIVPDPP